MTSHPECIPCIVEQTLRAVKKTSGDQQVQMKCLHDICSHFSETRSLDNPARESQQAYEIVMAHTGNSDPYRGEMRWANKLAAGILESLPPDSPYMSEIESAIRLSAAGNAIDYGPQHSDDIEGDVRKSIEEELAISHIADFISSLKNADNILFLADNAGEILFDSILLSVIERTGVNITIAVKSGPILNDVTMEVATEIGLDENFHVIGTGSNAMGVDFTDCSDEFRAIFNSADIILAKGQANFESLHGIERELYFLLRVKCSIIAAITGGNEGKAVLLHQRNGQLVHK